MTRGNYYQLYIAAHNNAGDILQEAKLLFDSEYYARAYFLAFTALEEIAKSQMAADVWTGFTSEEDFRAKYTHHDGKVSAVEWATLDAENFVRRYGEDISIKLPSTKKRMAALYTDVKENNVSQPKESINREDAEMLIKTVEVAFEQIFLQSEWGGNQIGTKGFMK